MQKKYNSLIYRKKITHSFSLSSTMRCIKGELSRLNWGHPRKNPSKKFGCDTSCKFVTQSRSNFSDEVFFPGCRNLWMVCVKIRRCIKGEASPCFWWHGRTCGELNNGSFSNFIQNIPILTLCPAFLYREIPANFRRNLLI